MSIKPRYGKAFALVSAAAIAALLVGACSSSTSGDEGSSSAANSSSSASSEVAESSGSSPAESESSAESSATESAASEPLETLTIASTTRYSLDEIGLALAMDGGIYDDMGFTLEEVEAQDLGRAVASGAADIGIGSPTRLLPAILKGDFDAVMIGPTTQKFMLAFAVRKDLGITDLADLKGHKFGVSSFGSLGDLGAQLLASEQGWTENDYERIALGGPDALAAGITNGSIDAFAWTPLLPFALQGEDKAVAIVGDVAEEFAPYGASVIFASPQAVKDNPRELKAFCEGFYEGNRILADDHDQLAELLIEGGGYTDSESLREAVNTFAPYLATSSEMNEDMLANVLKATQISSDSLEDATVEDLAKHYVSCESL